MPIVSFLKQVMRLRLKNSFTIKDISISSRFVLAPMAGISDPSYIKIVEDMGCGLAFTELISAEAIVRGNKKTLEMLNGLEKIKIPVGVQIFGSNPEVMASAAKILTNLYPIKIIDINMGCPVPKVALRASSGSALLKDPEKVRAIVRAVVKSVDIPVTVKIRSGWDEEHINAPEIAHICEEAGASAISIHARTRSQGYTGSADWNMIKKVKTSVSIPVIGNGDVTSPNKAIDMLEQTGCDAVMIGRAAMGNPWIFKECNEYLENGQIDEPSNIEKIAMIKHHYQLLKEDKSKKLALLEIRTHALAYLKGMPDAKNIKDLICKVKTEEELLKVLDDYQITLETNKNG